MPLQVPLTGIEQIEAAELESGSPIIGGRREVAAQKVYGHLALPAPLQGRRAWGDIRIDGGLGVEPSRRVPQREGEGRRSTEHLLQH